MYTPQIHPSTECGLIIALVAGNAIAQTFAVTVTTAQYKYGEHQFQHSFC